MMITTKGTKGFTLIEVVIVFTVVGLIFAGIWVGISTALQSKNLSDMRRQIAEATVNAREYFAGHNLITAAAATAAGTQTDSAVIRYSGNSNEFVNEKTTEFFPSEVYLIDLGGGFPGGKAPYSLSGYRIALGTRNAAQKFDFAVAIFTIPYDTCVNLLSSMNGMANYLGATTLTAGISSVAMPTLPINIATMNNICANARDSSNRTSVRLWFDLS